MTLLKRQKAYATAATGEIKGKVRDILNLINILNVDFQQPELNLLNSFKLNEFHFDIN